MSSKSGALDGYKLFYEELLSSKSLNRIKRSRLLSLAKQ